MSIRVILFVYEEHNFIPISTKADRMSPESDKTKA